MNKYEAKSRYIQNRNLANREQVDGKLTDEQVGALEWLCKVRHDIHTNGAKTIFNTEASGHDNIMNMLECELDDTMTDAGFDFPSIRIDPSEWVTDLDWFEDIINHDDFDDDFEKFAESARANINQEIEHVNAKIEKFLMDIDREFGTTYCPTGFARLM